MQERALKSGPSPSEACVEEGAETQSFLKSALPSLNGCSSSKGMLAEICEKESLGDRIDRCRAARLHRFVLFRLGEIGGRSRHVGDAFHVCVGKVGSRWSEDRS